MELYQWLSLGSIALGFLITWQVGSFKLGRAVEKIRIDAEEEASRKTMEVVRKVAELEVKVDERERVQESRFGETAAALRERVREVEMWGRDNYVQKPEFDRAVETMRQDVKELARSIKEDFKEVFAKIDAGQRQ